MAGQADGSVYVNTELDPQGFEAGSEQLKTAIKSLNAQMKGLGPALKQAMRGNIGAMQDFKNRANELSESVKKIESEMEALGHKPVPTEQYERLTKAMDEAAYKAEALRQKQKEMRANGVSEYSSKWKQLQEQIDKATKTLDMYNASCANMESSGLAFKPGTETAEYTRLANALNVSKAALAEMQTQAGRAEVKAVGISEAFRKVGTTIKTAAKTVGGALLNGLKKAVAATRSLIAGNKRYKNSFGGILSMIKRVGVGLLGFRGVYMILSKAVSAYMEQNETLSNKMASCWSKLGNLLGPIITRVIDLVATAISYITALLELIGLTGSTAAKAVNGAGSAAKKAERSMASFDELNVLQDKSGAGGGDAANYEFKDAELPSWVENVVNQIKSGSWSQAATTLADAFNGFVSSVDWAGVGERIAYYLDGALEFASTAINEFDWEALGGNLATSLNNIVSGVDWGNLGHILLSGFQILMESLTGFFSTLDGAEISNAVHEFICGGIEAVDWPGASSRLFEAISNFMMAIDYKQLASDLSYAFMTVLQVLSSAVANFDWHGLGRAVGEFLSSIDWLGVLTTVAELVCEAVKAAIEAVCGFLEGLGPEMIIAAIATVVAVIAGKIAVTTLLAPIVSAIGTALANVVAGIVAAIGGWPALLIAAAAAAIAALAVWIKNGGAEVIAGWWQGMKEGLKNIGGWIKEHIVDPFINGFKKLFGIHSPSTVMAEQGGFIIDGLLKGITDGWGAITKFFGDALSSITSKIGSAWSQIKSNASSAWSVIKSTVSSAWSGIKTAATNGYNSVKGGVLNAWSSIRSNTATAWSNIKNTIKNQGWTSIGSNICQGIGNGLSNGWSWLSRQVSNLARNMLNAAKRALGIHSPSRMFRDAVGLNIGYGIGEGIVASEGSILDSVAGVANAIAEEFNAGTYGENLLPTAEVDGALASFTDRITDSFAALLEKMDAIARNIGFSAPAIAGSVVPYTVAANAAGNGNVQTSTTTDGYLLSLLAEVQALSRIVQNLDVGHSGDTKVIINGREVFQTVVDENNRAIMRWGTSPLKQRR